MSRLPLPAPALVDRHVMRSGTRGIAQMLALMLMVDGLFALLDALADVEVRNGMLPALGEVARETPWRLVELGPYVALLGVLVGLGALAARGELTAMRAAGVMPVRLTGAAALPGALFVMGTTLLLEIIAAAPGAPDAQERAAIWHRLGDEVLYVRLGVDGGVERALALELEGARAVRGIGLAQGGRMPSANGDATVILEDVSLIRPHDPGAPRIPQARRSAVQLRAGAPWRLLKLRAVREPAQLTLIDLIRIVAGGHGGAGHRMALWVRLTEPLAVVGLVMAGTAFLFGPLREHGVGARLLAGAGLALAFRFAQQTLAPLMLVAGLPPAVAAGMPVAVVLAGGSWLLRRVA